ncbi:conserved protein of unknown function [Methylorubrum extorquens]|uniref:Uncharacterized protein n=1 Tax=Methylorubrum extorquens TaxID=408 RepID=A0A2N9AR36_METEX|nr:conserved protein of unknown function [Methylorubrum extorquens]
MSEAAPSSWFADLYAGVADYADAALRSTAEAGEAMGAQLATALARVQALPEEAAAAVSALTTALDLVLPPGHDPLLAAPRPVAEACPAEPRQDGGIGMTPRPVPRRLTVRPEAFAAFIRARHPHKPAEQCAALTGIPFDSVDKMLKREALPNGRNFLLCIIAYGPELLAVVMPDADERWLAGARILADQAHLESELARVRDAMAENTGRWSFCGISFGGAL